MAELTVDVVKIDAVHQHPNADRLSIAQLGGYFVVVGLDEYKPGDTAVYFPVDAILPQELEDYCFKGTKMSLSKGRVRAAKVRGHVSPGFLLSAAKANQYFNLTEPEAGIRIGDDLTNAFKVTKYQPPVKLPRGLGTRNPTAKRYCNPEFHKYTSIQHLQKYPNIFHVGEDVLVTEKLHGTNFRAGWVPWIPRTFFQKIFKKLFGKLRPRWEFAFGSHNVQLNVTVPGKPDPDQGNVYERIVKEHDLENKIPKGQIWYGEIIGGNIQKNFNYGLGDQLDVYFFDVFSHTAPVGYLNFKDAENEIIYAEEKMVPGKMVPGGRLLGYSLGGISDLLNHPPISSRIDPNTKAEGFVVRSTKEARKLGQRKLLKLISEDYLLQKGNTDYH
jgi:RNA ligase (TIGR02306 family)